MSDELQHFGQGRSHPSGGNIDVLSDESIYVACLPTMSPIASAVA